MDIKELIGVTLGSCTLERVIGRGGMGAVYLAQQSRPVRTVAVKVLVPSAGDPEQQRIFLERFRREADTVAKLEHKNILPIYEYEEAVVGGQKLAYIVMPYIRGGTLRDRIDEMNRAGTYFDLETVASYINQMADALSYAHTIGIIHRDVKPSNLLFHQDGRLLLSDFGIVRLSALPALTSIGSFLGTAEYASPEQVHTSEVDYRSDIYSLGVVLYELLTGDVPFTGANPFSVMNMKIREDVPLVRDVRPDLPFAIEAVVLKALAKSPDERYQTAIQLATDLDAAVAALSPQDHGLLLSGDADNNEMTVAEPSWQAAPPTNRPRRKPSNALYENVARPERKASNALPASTSRAERNAGGAGSGKPTRSQRKTSSAPPATPVFPERKASNPLPANTPATASVGAAFRQKPVRESRWASQAEQYLDEEEEMQMQMQMRNAHQTADMEEEEEEDLLVAPSALSEEEEEDEVAGTLPLPGKRLLFYGTALISILLQVLVFMLLNMQGAVSSEVAATASMLGVLVGSGINLLALAAMCFTSVVRSRSIRMFLYRTFAVAALTPLISGLFIGFGDVTNRMYLPIVAYVVLVISNIYALYQLYLVDAPHEDLEDAPVLWRPALVGAATGFLPLTIILVFALATPFSHWQNMPPWVNLLGILFIVAIGTPTPGAVLAVWLSETMTFPIFLRTSAIAGLLMFAGALVIVVLWGLIFTNHTDFLYSLDRNWLALLLIVSVMAVLGALRGMLDATVYYRFKDRLHH